VRLILNMATAQQVVNKMFEKDAFSQLLGLQIDEVRDGYCKLHFTVTGAMMNGFEVLHGGVTYSAADSALAFAANSYNRLSLALSCTIDYMESGKVGDVLFVEALEESCRNKTATYVIRVTKQNGTLMALFKGTVYRTSKFLMEE
jgi:acyl-CoA thioesterase